MSAEADAHQPIGAADQQARRHGLEDVDQKPLQLVHSSPWARRSALLIGRISASGESSPSRAGAV
jgi:hypothetical protein